MASLFFNYGLISTMKNCTILHEYHEIHFKRYDVIITNIW